MAKKTGRGFAAILTIGCGVAAGIAVYKNREWLKAFSQELTGEAPPVHTDTEPPQPEEINIVIDRSGEEE